LKELQNSLLNAQQYFVFMLQLKPGLLQSCVLYDGSNIGHMPAGVFFMLFLFEIHPTTSVCWLYDLAFA
jgi:hypothetical protein